MRVLTFGLVLTAAGASAIFVPATAHADFTFFKSPSGNITCILDSTVAECDIAEYTFTPPPPPPDCDGTTMYGNRFSLRAGKPAVVTCHGDTTASPGEPILKYGQSVTAGTLTCTSEQSGVQCADSSTGHYFRVARGDFELG
ncbi:DUF6636 domain-containing protein [Mycobacterium sp.]|uniref:DUF6636 domain-containing protein n=1 Tax=Mycobacterium sp. TaxID=1785 RepID=UPI003A847B2B